MMTKKDYILIADCLNLLVQSTDSMKQYPQDIDFIVNQVVNKFKRELQDDNPLFNEDKFLKAVNKAV